MAVWIEKFLDAAVKRKNGIRGAFEEQYERALVLRQKALGIAA